MEVEDHFITFGCWNNGYCGDKTTNGLSMIMDRLLREDRNFNKLIVLGDNYYPDSVKLEGKKDKSDIKKDKKTDKSISKKDKKKDKSEKSIKDKKDKKVKGIKIKKLNRRKLEKGFDCLSNVADHLDAQVYLLTGNHETDRLLDDVEYTPETIEENSYNCLSLHLQQLIVYNNDRFNLIGWDPTGLSDAGYFDIKHSNTMIYIFLDTNIYDDMDEMCSYDIRTFREIVKMKIIEELSENPGKSVTFFGHVPLFTCRIKDDEDVGSLCNNSNKIFLDIFDNPDIFKILLDVKYIYYICADTHYYQQSMITLKSGLVLTQYIVGTGGADLDVHSDEIGLCLPTNKVKKGRELPIPSDYISESYIIQSEDTFGYLKCAVFNGQLNTMFVNVDYGSKLPRKIKGTKKKKQNKNNKNKLNKLKTINKKKKRRKLYNN